MLNNYFKRSLMLLGASAFIATAANAGAWRDVTHKYIKDAAYLPSWQGHIAAVGDGVGEVWNAAFNLYQVIPDLPAGEYTLSANAFYRCGKNDFAKANMTAEKPENYSAYIYINGTTKKVAGLFDGGKETAPNSMAEANAAFAAGEYLNTVTVNHPGGDLVLGIKNTGGYDDEWCCFDNFTLTGPNGAIAVPNGDFAQGLDPKANWNNWSSENKEKFPDYNKDEGGGRGAYRKCGGSPYNIGQQVELPAGKYRFGMLCFHRYGSTVGLDGTYYNHKSGAVTAPYGVADRTPKQWYEANDYDTYNAEHPSKPYSHAYIYMSKNTDKPRNLDLVDDFGDIDLATSVLTRVKDVWEIWKGDLQNMPDNNVKGPAGTLIPYEESRNKCLGLADSGLEREAAAGFVNEPEKYWQYVEFTLTETTKVWLGLGKNTNTSDGYWHPWTDQKLLVLGGGAGVDNVVVDEQNNAPVEYFNLQGVRVENPTRGLYIKRQGNKATKVIL